MMGPVATKRVTAAFSLLRESITVVKGLTKVMAAAPQKRAVTPVEADTSPHGDAARDSALQGLNTHWMVGGYPSRCPRSVASHYVSPHMVACMLGSSKKAVVTSECSSTVSSPVTRRRR
jgi:hypothetical protein